MYLAPLSNSTNWIGFFLPVKSAKGIQRSVPKFVIIIIGHSLVMRVTLKNTLLIWYILQDLEFFTTIATGIAEFFLLFIVYS